MENRSHALMAGLFTILLGLAAVASIWWFGGSREQTKEFVVVTRQNVTGLSSQAQVRYRGIRVGKVQEIKLDPQDGRNILIRVWVSDTVPLTRGTTAKLGFQGVTGIAHILLEETGRDPSPLTGSGDELPRIAMQPSLFEELADAGGDTMRSARDLLVNANKLLNAENRERISKTLANLEATTRNAEETLDRMRQLLSPENIRLLSSTLARTEQAVGQVAPFISEARGLVSSLQATSGKLEAVLGDPTTGGAATLVPRLTELSSELTANSRQLNRVLHMLEESPQSLVFGRQPLPPGPGETGFIAPVMAKDFK